MNRLCSRVLALAAVSLLCVHSARAEEDEAPELIVPKSAATPTAPEAEAAPAPGGARRVLTKKDREAAVKAEAERKKLEEAAQAQAEAERKVKETAEAAVRAQEAEQVKVQAAAEAKRKADEEAKAQAKQRDEARQRQSLEEARMAERTRLRVELESRKQALAAQGEKAQALTDPKEKKKALLAWKKAQAAEHKKLGMLEKQLEGLDAEEARLRAEEAKRRPLAAPGTVSASGAVDAPPRRRVLRPGEAKASAEPLGANDAGTPSP